MKRILLLLLAVALLVGFLAPFLNQSGLTDTEQPASFGFKENLATTYGKTIAVPLKITESLQNVAVYLDDSLIFEKKNPSKKEVFFINTTHVTLGAHLLELRATNTDGSPFSEQRNLRILSDLKPDNWTLEIVKNYPHTRTSFTQGLEFLGTQLFEGTGDPNEDGSSMVAKVALADGAIGFKKNLDASKFGEGITILNGELFQLTWKNQQCFVYDVNSLEIKRELAYTGEGWGLCNDGQQLIMSDGTERITFRDPKTFSAIRTIEVYTDQGPLPRLNELEYVDGLIYANIWTSSYIAVIDPKLGRVLALIDAQNLVKEGQGTGEVLNGIAYQSATKKLFMTGKLWPTLFEVRIVK
ncbi:MAG: hypothetical protein RLZZ301_779 [Bacteroidota bacterium]|jgi:glutamine cyclotransferase